MLRIDPEIVGVDIVLLGDFNPAIFSPRWFSVGVVQPRGPQHRDRGLREHQRSLRR